MSLIGTSLAGWGTSEDDQVGSPATEEASCVLVAVSPC
jgi:hypothetical protein